MHVLLQRIQLSRITLRCSCFVDAVQDVFGRSKESNATSDSLEPWCPKRKSIYGGPLHPFTQSWLESGELRMALSWQFTDVESPQPFLTQSLPFLDCHFYFPQNQSDIFNHRHWYGNLFSNLLAQNKMFYDGFIYHNSQLLISLLFQFSSKCQWIKKSVFFSPQQQGNIFSMPTKKNSVWYFDKFYLFLSSSQII